MRTSGLFSIVAGVAVIGLAAEGTVAAQRSQARASSQVYKGTPEQQLQRNSRLPQQQLERAARIPERRLARSARVPERQLTRNARIPERQLTRNSGVKQSQRAQRSDRISAYKQDPQLYAQQLQQPGFRSLGQLGLGVPNSGYSYGGGTAGSNWGRGGLTQHGYPYAGYGQPWGYQYGYQNQDNRHSGFYNSPGGGYNYRYYSQPLPNTQGSWGVGSGR